MESKLHRLPSAATLRLGQRKKIVCSENEEYLRQKNKSTSPNIQLGCSNRPAGQLSFIGWLTATFRFIHKV